VSLSFKSRSGWLTPAAVLIYLVVGFLIAAFVWSLYAELDQTSRATGQVIPTGRVQVVQSNDGGVIKAINVLEGDSVRSGQVLVQLDEIKIKASVDEAQGKVASLKSSMARINAELFDRPLVFDEDVRNFSEFVSNQTQLYKQRRRALTDQLASLEAMLTLQQQELDMNLPLLEQGDVSRADVLRLRRGVTDIRAQMVNVKNKYLQDLQAEYTKTEEDLVTAREILAQRQDALNDTIIRAPTDGVVKNVRLTTLGGVLRPGDEVLTIVPTGQKLIVEAKVSPSDIAYLRVGQTVSIKFDAYDSSIYSSAQGLVSYIGADTLTEQKAGGEIVYYRVHVTVDTSRMKPRPGEKVEIQPGMTATVEIKTGRNTVFRYLTKPLTQAVGEAMTER
jgi:adhesin transport system membrane fusion protein